MYSRMLFSLALVFAAGLAAQTTNLSLASSAGTPHFGQAVTLTAAVTPSDATGKVTFYDGVSVLGTSQIVDGQASFPAILLNSGKRSLRA